MRCVRSALLLTLLAGLVFLPPTIRSADKPPSDDQLLIDAGLGSDGPALLQFFRTRAKPTATREELQALIDHLSDNSAEARSKAAADLIAHGPLAIPVLRRCANDLGDRTLAERARRCLHAIEGPGGIAFVNTAARQLALKKPEGAADALLQYLPFADDQSVVDEVWSAVGSLAIISNSPDPALVKALDDPLPLRRACAGAALCRAENAETRKLGARLLKDPTPLVRMWAGLALLERRDVDAVPVLIELMADLPPLQRNQAEDGLRQIAGEWAPNLNLPEDDVSRRIRRDAWASWWTNTDGPALLREFRQRTLRPEDRKKLEVLIRQLGDESFDAREQAVPAVVAFGLRAMPLLRAAGGDTDVERARRVDDCIRQIEQGKPSVLPSVAPRLLAMRKPDGAVEALFDYLPFADVEGNVDEVKSALALLAVHNGEPDALLVRALDDKDGARRVAAAEALAGARLPNLRAPLLRMLTEADKPSRLRVARALALAGEKDAVPVLIDLLAELPLDQSWPAQEILTELAGDKAPPLTGDKPNDPANRTKWKDAWAVWWKDHGAGVDLAKLQNDGRITLGYTVMCEIRANNQGRVVELGRDGKPRWQIDNVAFPVDVHMLPGQHVLIAEYNGGRVTERDLTGKVLWEKNNLNQPINCMRLNNGNTFITTRMALIEVDRNGKEVMTINRPGDVNSAGKMPDGRIALITQNGLCVIYDAKGTEQKSFSVQPIAGWTSGVDVLPNGRILIPQMPNQKVVEYDLTGKVVWEAKTPGSAISATRLRSGNTLVACQEGGVYELDRNGKVVWEYKDEGRRWRARRR
jgi:HEAT repeat protein/outer membrane protein assembly factor BamB